MFRRVGAPARVAAAVALLLLTTLAPAPFTSAGVAPITRHALAAPGTSYAGPAAAPEAGWSSSAGAGAPPPPSTPRNVLADAPCNLSANAEVVSAYDAALGYLYVAWIGCFGIGFARSVDGGYSFQPAFAVPESAVGFSSWDPAIAVAPNGTVYVAYMINDGGDTPVVTWSWDHGVSFAGYSFVMSPSSSEFSDRDYIAVAPNGTVYVTWDYSPQPSYDVIGCAPGGSCYFTAGDLNIAFVRSSDGGKTWSALRAINPDAPWGGCPAGPLLVEPNGTIDVLYEDYNSTGANHTLTVGYNYYTRSADGGATWSTRVRVSNLSFSNHTWWIDGQIARDAGGTLYATFDAQTPTTDTAYVAVSTDDGGRWATPKRLNPDSNSAAHALVGVDGGAAGTAYIAWLTNNTTAGWSSYLATLTGNGSTLSAPLLVSARTGITGYWVGDTLGVAFLGSGAVEVAWSYGVSWSNVSASQVFSAVVGEVAPTGVASPLPIIPGVGQAIVGWRPSTNPADRISGFYIGWGLEGQITFWNLTAPRSAVAATLPNLPAGYRWYFIIAEVNGAGRGPFTAPSNFTLTAWGVVKGAVTPPSATVHVDTSTATVTAGAYSFNTTIGPHELVVSLTNYGTFYQAIVLPWNGTVWQNATLSELPGALEGYIAPLRATVTLDGSAVFVASNGLFSVAGLVPGLHILRASFPTFVSITRNLSIPANATLWANVTLAPANGTIHLMVKPAAALVKVRGVGVSLSPTGEANLTEPPGIYPVVAQATGYVTVQTNVTVVGSSTSPLSLNLTRAPAPKSNASGAFTFLIPGTLLLVIAAVLAVAVAVAALVVRRRRAAARSAPSDEELWEPDDEVTPEESSPAPDEAGPGGPA